MKKLITLIAVFAFTANADVFLWDPIPNASYLIYEDGRRPHPFSERTRNPSYVTFYTFDGNPIITLDHGLAFPGFPKVNHPRLDYTAPKPQPVTYEIKPVSIIHGLFKSGKCIISFYDKHDNVIANFECYKKGKSLSFIITNPTVKPGHIGAFTKLTVPDFEFLRTITPSTTLPLDLSGVTEKPRK